VWLIPAIVALIVATLSTSDIGWLIGGLIALVVVTIVVSRPGFALLALVIFLPLQLMGFALLYPHIPGSILRPSGVISELLAIAILAAALREMRATGRGLDRIDLALLLYVAVVTVYLLEPHLFAATSTASWTTREYAWRSDAAYPLLFFAVRHAPIPPQVRTRFIQVVIGLGVLVAGLALYQQVAPASWTNFVLNTAHLGIYEAKVAGIAPYLVIQELEYLFSLSPLRVSSIFASPFDMSDYLVVVVAIVAVRIKNGGRPSNYVVLAMALAAIYFSRVRGDALAVVVILFLIALPGSRHNVAGRLRLLAVLCIGALLIVPSLAGSRYVNAQGGSQSNSEHIKELEHGLTVITTHPLGLGLGAEPSDRQGLIPGSSDTSENAFLQVVDELGIFGLLPWLAMMAFVFSALYKRARDGDVVAASFGWALLAILIAGVTHHVFLVLTVPWTLWGGIGLALSDARQPAEPTYGELQTNPGLPAAGVP
jgi:O-antigen ligase